jgi:hypothetical protein
MRWKAEDIKLEDDEGYFLSGRIGPMVDNPSTLEAFRQFSVEFAFENEPGIKSIDKEIEAQRINVGQFKRRFFLPRFSTKFLMDQELSSNTVGETSLTSGSSSSFTDYDADSTDWAWNVTASIPLFEGGGRFYDVARAKAELSRVEDSKVLKKQLTDRSVRSAIYSIESSHPNIRLFRESAASALKNLEVVRDKYKRGTVNILDLLDAQNEAFRTEEAAVIAVYSYLQDVIRYQRAIAWFEVTKSEEERQKWVKQAESYIKANAVQTAPTFRQPQKNGNRKRSSRRGDSRADNRQ